MKYLLDTLALLALSLFTLFALDKRNFDATGSGSKGAPKIATYSTSDTIATVAGAGYFNGLASLLTTGDLIYVYSSAGGTTLNNPRIYQVTKSGSTVTLSTSIQFT